MIGALSDIGNVRKINEDSIGYYEEDTIKIYIVADGMGGHNAGEIASSVAVETTIEYVKASKFVADGREILTKAIIASNEKIYSLAQKNEDMNGMGTTITACLITGNKIFIANIGDSSCYIVNNNIMKVTKDHSLVQELIDEGSITEDQARNHPSKNIITRALGTSSSVEVDIYELSLGAVNKVILCSDGLTNEVSGNEMLEIIRGSSDNTDACRRLIEVAKSRGSRDNITVMIFEGECGNDRNATE